MKKLDVPEPETRFLTAQMKGPTFSSAQAIRSVAKVAVLGAILHGPAFAQQTVPAMPMQPVQQDGAAYRLLQKKVLSSRPLRDATCATRTVGRRRR